MGARRLRRRAVRVGSGPQLGQLSLWILGGILVLLAIAYIVMAAVWISHGGYDDNWHRGRMGW